MPKQRAGGLFAFHSSSSLWGQILLSNKSNTTGTAVPQPDKKETSVETSVEHIIMPRARGFLSPGLPQNSPPDGAYMGLN